jgi:hypothetical protein
MLSERGRGQRPAVQACNNTLAATAAVALVVAAAAGHSEGRGQQRKCMTAHSLILLLLPWALVEVKYSRKGASKSGRTLPSTPLSNCKR